MHGFCELKSLQTLNAQDSFLRKRACLCLMIETGFISNKRKKNSMMMSTKSSLRSQHGYMFTHGFTIPMPYKKTLE